MNTRTVKIWKSEKQKWVTRKTGLKGVMPGEVFTMFEEDGEPAHEGLICIAIDWPYVTEGGVTAIKADSLEIKEFPNA